MKYLLFLTILSICPMIRAQDQPNNAPCEYAPIGVAPPPDNCAPEQNYEPQQYIDLLKEYENEIEDSACAFVNCAIIEEVFDNN